MSKKPKSAIAQKIKDITSSLLSIHTDDYALPRVSSRRTAGGFSLFSSKD